MVFNRIFPEVSAGRHEDELLCLSRTRNFTFASFQALVVGMPLEIPGRNWTLKIPEKTVLYYR